MKWVAPRQSRKCNAMKKIAAALTLPESGPANHFLAAILTGHALMWRHHLQSLTVFLQAEFCFLFQRTQAVHRQFLVCHQSCFC